MPALSSELRIPLGKGSVGAKIKDGPPRLIWVRRAADERRRLELRRATGGPFERSRRSRNEQFLACLVMCRARPLPC
jgi:hypothetical protein